MRYIDITINKFLSLFKSLQWMGRGRDQVLEYWFDI